MMTNILIFCAGLCVGVFATFFIAALGAISNLDKESK